MRTILSSKLFSYGYLILSFIIGSSLGRIHKVPLTHFFVFGEKFSGVKYLSKLLNQTSPSFPLQECKAIHPQHGTIRDDQEAATSWRHGFLSVRSLKKNLDCNLDQTLFIMIVKDVRSMLCSVAKRKFKVSSKNLIEMHLNALIVHRWEDSDHLDLNGKANTKNPSTKTYNYLKLRSQKLSNHYATLSGLKHGVVTRYEDLIQEQSTEIKNILRGRGLVLGKTFDAKNFDTTVTVNETKLCHQRFTPKIYSKVIKKLNKRIETKIGYSLTQPNYQSNTQVGLTRNIWTLLLDLLWWIIVPTLVVLSIVIIPILFKETCNYLFPSSIVGKSRLGTISKRELNFETKSKWIQVMERTTGRIYYVNKETGRVQWNRPSHFERYTGIDPILNNSVDYFTRYSKMD